MSDYHIATKYNHFYWNEEILNKVGCVSAVKKYFTTFVEDYDVNSYMSFVEDENMRVIAVHHEDETFDDDVIWNAVFDMVCDDTEQKNRVMEKSYTVLATYHNWNPSL